MKQRQLLPLASKHLIIRKYIVLFLILSNNNDANLARDTLHDMLCIWDESSKVQYFFITVSIPNNQTWEVIKRVCLKTTKYISFSQHDSMHAFDQTGHFVLLSQQWLLIFHVSSWKKLKLQLAIYLNHNVYILEYIKDLTRFIALFNYT